MSKWLSRISTLLIGLFVAGGLTFGATQAFGSSEMMVCGDDVGEIGTCPPFSNESCEVECLEREFFGGACIATETQGVICCACIV